MDRKIILLLVAVFAIGLFAMPNTVSLFSGQHTFYPGKNVSCDKCHQDIYDEITSPENGVHGNKADCSGCHRTTSGSLGADIGGNIWKTGGGSPVTIKAHAAVTVECLACHGINTNDKMFGVAEQISTATEAHRDFYFESVSDKEIGDINQVSLAAAKPGLPAWYGVGNGTASKPQGNQSVIKLKGTNTACVGCHTHSMVNITWSRSIGYEMTVNATNTGMDINFTGVSETKNVTYSSKK